VDGCHAWENRTLEIPFSSKGVWLLGEVFFKIFSFIVVGSPPGVAAWDGGPEEGRTRVAWAPGAGKDSWGEDGEIEEENAGQELHLGDAQTALCQVWIRPAG
jgi:hypothetical protein